MGPERVAAAKERSRDSPSVAEPSGAGQTQAESSAAERGGVTHAGGRALTPTQIASLQRAAGNLAVTELVAGNASKVQRAPRKTGGAAPVATPAKGVSASADSYLDLLNGFHQMAIAAIDEGGKGLTSVRFGRNLTRAQRSLLGRIRTMFIDAMSSDRESRRRAAAAWPRLAAQLHAALPEARKARISMESVAGVVDLIAFVGKHVGAKQGKDEPEVQTHAGFGQAVWAIEELLRLFNNVLEPGEGFQQEEVEGRKDVDVSDAIRDRNAKLRAQLNAVKFGDKLSKRHATLLTKLRTTLLKARSEAPGSAYQAFVWWHRIERAIRSVLNRAPSYRVSLDVGAAQQAVDAAAALITEHRARVHHEQKRAVLTKVRRPGELKAEKEVEKRVPKQFRAAMAQKRTVEDFESALGVIERLVPNPDRPGEWLIPNGSAYMRIHEFEAVDLDQKATAALRAYMVSLVDALLWARNDYDAIKLGNSRFKLRVLGFMGGADDPGSFDAELARMIEIRESIYGIIANRRYVDAFKKIMAEKPEVERRVKAQADYDADLDRGYSRLGTTMAVVQVALTALVPIAGAAVTGASAVAIGVGSVAAGSGGAFVAEGSRQLATGERDAGKLLQRTTSGGVVGFGAVAGPATQSFGKVIAGPGASRIGLAGGEAVASSLIGGTQSVIEGGSFGEGFVEGFLGSTVGSFTKLGPAWLQTRAPNTLIQTSTGAGIASLTGKDPIVGAAGNFVGTVLTPSARPRPAGKTQPPARPAAPMPGAPATAGASAGAVIVPDTGGSPPRTPAPSTVPPGAAGATTTPGPGVTPPRRPAVPPKPPDATGAKTTPGTGVTPPRTPAAPAKPIVGDASGATTVARPKPAPVDPVAAKLIPQDSSSALQAFADNHDLVIKVRPMNRDAIARLEGRDASGEVVDAPAMPKPDIIKAKSITEVDEHIGGPAKSRGFIGLFEPHPPRQDLSPELLKAATERYEARLKEWNNRDADYGQFMRSGILRVDGGVIQLLDPRVPGATPGELVFRKVAGDIDIFDITHASGRKLSVDEMNHIEQRLRSMGIAVEHGAHKHWPSQHRESYEKNVDVYRGIIEQHVSQTPLVAFVPKEKPISVWADTSITRPARRDMPGERIMPFDEPSVVVSSEYLKEVEAARRAAQPPGPPKSGTAASVAMAPEPVPQAATGARTAPQAATVPEAKPKGRPLLPNAAVPSNLAAAGKPVFDLTVPMKEQVQDLKQDIAAEGGMRSATPSVKYAPEEDGRYTLTDQKPPTGISAEKSTIVIDTRDNNNNKMKLFKPLESELPIDRAEARGVREGEQAPREVAASIAAKYLGVDAPNARLVTIGGKQGVLIDWHAKNTLEDLRLADPVAHYRLINSEAFRAAITRLDALDYLINNLDRGTNWGNYLYEFTNKELRLTAIDHGLSFTGTRGRTDIMAFTRGLPETYPPDLVDNLRKLDRAEFIEKIKPFVGEGAIPGVIERLDIMLRDMEAKQAAQR